MLRRPSLSRLAVFVSLTSVFLACAIREENEEVAGSTTSGSGGTSTTVGTTTSTTTSTGGASTATGTGGSGGSVPNGDGVVCGDQMCPPEMPICCAGMSDLCTADQGDATCAGTAVATDFIVYCDHSAACASDELCCHVDGSIDKLECTLAALCQLGEVCLPGGTCAQPAFECVVDPDEATGAKCVAPGAEVNCDKAICLGSTPECCDDGTGTLTCQAISDGCALGLDCDDASDCASGYACCFDGGTSYCGASCPTYVLCTDATQCPDVANTTKTCETDAAAGLPTGWLVCTYK